MNGIEKITQRILSEAHEYADEKIKTANEEAERINKDFANKISELKAQTDAEAEDIKSKMLERIDSQKSVLSSAANLKAKSEVIDKTFDTALQKISNLSANEFTELYMPILRDALNSQLENEKLHEADLNDDDAVSVSDYYLYMNKKDAPCFEALKAGVNEILSASGKTLTFSEKVTDISGGFVLVCGDVEINCSSKTLIKQQREKLEEKIVGILFD